MYERRRGGIILAGLLGGYLGSGTLAAYCGSKAFSRIFSEALWAESAAFDVDVLHLNVGSTATPAMERLGMDLTHAEPPDNVAQQALDNIANGPVWIVSTKGNVDRARAVSVVDDRAEVVRANSIPSRAETGGTGGQAGNGIRLASCPRPAQLASRGLAAMRLAPSFASDAAAALPGLRLA